MPENPKLFDRKVVFRIDFESMMLQNIKLYLNWLWVTSLVNEEFSVPLVIMSLSQAVHLYNSVHIKYKILPKVIGDVWHNGEGSTVYKSRRIGLTSADILITCS